jgi:phosphoglycolate phosphatase
VTVIPALVLLDLDGTLTDSAPGIIDSVTRTYRALDLPAPTPAALRSFIGPPITRSFPTHGVPPARLDEAIAIYREHFAESGIWNNALYDGVLDQLELLRSAGYRLAIATSKPEVFARPIVERFGVSRYLNGVFGAGLDYTGSKTTVIARALATLAHDPQASRTLMVGDREHDVHGAADNGVPSLGVSWGYAEPGELVAAGAAHVIDDVNALAESIEAYLERS